jgi:peptidoglycan hydrolase-like amidase
MGTRIIGTQNAYRTGLATISLVICLTASKHQIAVHGQTSDGPHASAEAVRIGVMGLFHPRAFRVLAIAGQALILQADHETVMLEQSSGVGEATIHLSGTEVVVNSGAREIHASTISVTNRMNEPADFILGIPAKISRRYHGILAIQPSEASLLAIVTVDQETAVASVVAAESATDSPLEALKAQAVAARSYFVAGRGRHHNFDFCDTTHCQFFRSPPARNSNFAIAAQETRDLVLAYKGQPFAAMYTRSCSGRTHSLLEVGIHPVAYPYYAVPCAYCRSHPANWNTRLAARDAASLRSGDELARLKVARQAGWSAVPSNDFVMTKDGDRVMLHGIGNGHGIGLCQAGAKAMAESGATFREILNHYYPNTTIVSVSSEALRIR